MAHQKSLLLRMIRIDSSCFLLASLLQQLRVPIQGQASSALPHLSRWNRVMEFRFHRTANRQNLPEWGTTSIQI